MNCTSCGAADNRHVDTCGMEPMARVGFALTNAPAWEPGSPHVFFKWKNGDTFRSCARCGGCEPSKPTGKPCRGPVRVELRGGR